MYMFYLLLLVSIKPNVKKGGKLITFDLKHINESTIKYINQ